MSSEVPSTLIVAASVSGGAGPPEGGEMPPLSCDCRPLHSLIVTPEPREAPTPGLDLLLVPLRVAISADLLLGAIPEGGGLERPYAIVYAGNIPEVCHFSA